MYEPANRYWVTSTGHCSNMSRKSPITQPEETRRPRRPRQIPRVAVPSFFTLMNLFAGFLAITQIHEEQYEYACYLIILAGFFDLLDGMVARLANGQSRFGMELDSLSDVVSFGVAPSYLIYIYALSGSGVFGLLASAVPVLCAAVRLARFNVMHDGSGSSYFHGLPAPAQALAIVALVLNEHLTGRLFPLFDLEEVHVMVILFPLSFLMLTSIRFEAIPRPTIRYVQLHPYMAMAFISAGVITAVFQQTGFLIAITAYIVLGIVRAGMEVVRGIRDATPEPLESDQYHV